MFARALTVVLAIPLFAQSVLAQNTCTRTYTVQENDICDRISAANHASTWQLAVVNYGIINDACSNLSPGSTICLGWQGSDCTSVHVVDFGDTCDDVANQYNINVTTFNGNNPQLNSDCTNLYVGEVVCVDPNVNVPPPPASGTMPGSSIPATATAAAEDLPWCD